MRKSMFLVYSVRLSKKCSSSKLMSLSSFLLGEGLFVDMAYIYIYISIYIDIYIFILIIKQLKGTFRGSFVFVFGVFFSSHF
jgi:hypothetical protein